MSHKTYSVKRFIADFYFPNPDWEKLPLGFPDIPKTGLTREEGYLLDGIKLAYFATAGGWKKGLTVPKHGQALLIVLIGLISLISFISIITQPGGNEFTRTVNAATVQMDDLVQSTMSAILKR